MKTSEIESGDSEMIKFIVDEDIPIGIIGNFYTLPKFDPLLVLKDSSLQKYQNLY